MAQSASLDVTERADGGRRRRPWRWAGALAAVAVTLTGLVGLAGTAHAAPAGATAGQFVSLTNSARAAHGVHSLATASDLTSVAQRQAQRMADKGELFHNPNLTSEVHNWQKVGENVGYGPDAQAIHNAFMNSPDHRANILDRAYTQLGIGVVVKNGVVWVSEVFREPEATAPVVQKKHKQAPKPSPSPTPTSKPTHAPSGTATRTTTHSSPRPSSKPTPSPKPSPKPSSKAQSSPSTSWASPLPPREPPQATKSGEPAAVVSPTPSASATPATLAAAGGPGPTSSQGQGGSSPVPAAATLGFIALFGLAVGLRLHLLG
jgi:hypothetical protein